MATTKTGPSDGSYNEDDQDKKKGGSEKDEKFRKEMEELEEISKEMEKRKKEKLKQFKKREIEPKKQIREEKETKVGGQVTKKKVYGHKKGEGIFIRSKAKDYPLKIRKSLHKVHGLSPEEKKIFPDIVAAYNPTKTVLKKDKLKKLLYELKHIKSGRRVSADFNRLEETFNKSFLKKKFGKRKINNIERVLLGKKDPFKHKMKSDSNRTPSKGKPGSFSPMSKVGKRF